MINLDEPTISEFYRWGWLISRDTAVVDHHSGIPGRPTSDQGPWEANNGRYGGSMAMGNPQNAWLITENPIKMDDWGFLPYREPPYWRCWGNLPCWTNRNMLDLKGCQRIQVVWAKRKWGVTWLNNQSQAGIIPFCHHKHMQISNTITEKKNFRRVSRMV